MLKLEENFWTTFYMNMNLAALMTNPIAKKVLISLIALILFRQIAL